ncbi:MAG: EamA family transporter, partial [Microvirga sp.]
FVFQFAALARSSAVVAGIAFCAEPVVAALCSAIMLGERLSAVQLLGGALVLAAIVTNVMADRRRERAPQPQPAS